MQLLQFLLLIFMFYMPPMVSAQHILGTWVRVVESYDRQSGTEEKQFTYRTFSKDAKLFEKVIYEQHLRTAEDEKLVLSFECKVEGSWKMYESQDILLHYRYRHVEAKHIGTFFPDHAEEVQAELGKAFMAKNRREIENYVKTMQNILKQYYKRNDGTLIREVSIVGNTMTAILGNEPVSMLKGEPLD